MYEAVNSVQKPSACFSGWLVMVCERWAQLLCESNVPAGNGLEPFRCEDARLAEAAEKALGACSAFWLLTACGLHPQGSNAAMGLMRLGSESELLGAPQRWDEMMDPSCNTDQGARPACKVKGS